MSAQYKDRVGFDYYAGHADRGAQSVAGAAIFNGRMKR